MNETDGDREVRGVEVRGVVVPILTPLTPDERSTWRPCGASRTTSSTTASTASGRPAPRASSRRSTSRAPPGDRDGGRRGGRPRAGDRQRLRARDPSHHRRRRGAARLPRHGRRGDATVLLQQHAGRADRPLPCHRRPLRAAAVGVQHPQHRQGDGRAGHHRRAGGRRHRGGGQGQLRRGRDVRATRHALSKAPASPCAGSSAQSGAPP